MKRAVMALSGGMDSSALLLHLLAGGHTVTCLSFDYGQQHRLELHQAEALVQHLNDHQHEVVHRIVDLSSAMGLFSSHLLATGDAIPEGHYEEEAMKSTVVPNRNAIFASLLYGTALSIANDTGDDVAVALGVHSGDHAIYPDCRPEFYDALGEAFRIGNWGAERVSFTLPYLEMDKAGILLDAEVTTKALGLNFDDVFERTLTTYDPTPDGKSHGKTGSDIERILAFHAVGRRDPFPYVAGWDAVLAHALGEDRRHRAKALADRLTPLQWHVTQEAGTERAFTGEFWNASDPGTYACICCGKALFDHTSKFSSGCGWPSFHTERDHARIHRLVDRTHGMLRTEVRCSTCDAHLGHVFDDGPREHGGERYCINSASLTFIPQEEAA